MKAVLTYLFEKQENFLGDATEEHFDALFKIKHLTIEENNDNQKLLWMQIIHCVKKAKHTKEDQIILCENIAVLNRVVNTDLLSKVINEAPSFGAKILAGNISSEDATLIPVSDNLFWTDSLTECKFLVLYKSCFDLILNEDFAFYNSITECLESITSNKMLIYPIMYNLEQDSNNQHMEVRMKRLFQMHLHLKKNKLKLLSND